MWCIFHVVPSSTLGRKDGGLFVTGGEVRFYVIPQRNAFFVAALPRTFVLDYPSFSDLCSVRLRQLYRAHDGMCVYLTEGELCPIYCFFLL